MRGLSVCSGIGAFDLAMQAIGVKTNAYCEIDPFCQEVLLARMRDGWLDRGPIWPDLNTFPAGDFQGVDILYGGIPCQPHSTAGKRQGADDARDLWPATRRLVGTVRPSYVFLENVAGIRLRAGDAPAYAWRVTADLAALGYVGRWCTVSAAEVGAPHRRERWFCLAYAGRPGDERWGASSYDAGAEEARVSQASERERLWATPDHSLVALAHAAGSGYAEQERQHDALERAEQPDQHGGNPMGFTSSYWEGREPGEFPGLDTTSRIGRAPSQHDGKESRDASAILGNAAGDGRREGDRSSWERQPPAQPGAGIPGRAGGELAVARRDGRWSDNEREPETERGWPTSAGSIFPPGPGDRDAWAGILSARPDLAPATNGKLNARFVEWLQGVPVGWTEIEAHDTMIRDAITTQGRTYEILSLLPKAIASEAIRLSAGGSSSVSTPEILRHDLHESSFPEDTADARSTQKTSGTISEVGLRGVRNPNNAQYSSPRRQSSKQRPAESKDPVQLLSSEMALGTWTYQQSKPPQGSPLYGLWATVAQVGYVPETLSALEEIRRSASQQNARGTSDSDIRPRLVDKNRRKRLAALGNGCIPSQAVRAWRLLTEGA